MNISYSVIDPASVGPAGGDAGHLHYGGHCCRLRAVLQDCRKNCFLPCSENAAYPVSERSEFGTTPTALNRTMGGVKGVVTICHCGAVTRQSSARTTHFTSAVYSHTGAIPSVNVSIH